MAGQTPIGEDALRAAVATAVAAGDTPAARAAALLTLRAADLDAVIHARFEAGANVLARGLAASPGAASGRVYFHADDAADAADRGEPVILVCDETTPADVHGMMVAAGVLTTRGDLVSHAALVTRGWGTPAVVGADAITIADRSFSVDDVVVVEGDVISIDGSTGEVTLGERDATSGAPPAEFFTVLEWADDVRRGHLGVRANADTPTDAAQARQFGAEGIGLCRTEHMFLAPDRLPVVRSVILAATAEEEAAALDELGRVQQLDFVEILAAMDTLPVTVRLLDPPLHEFLPSVLELELKRSAGHLTREEERELVAAREWAEHNPMIGTRGVRLAFIKPGLYAMQVRALLAAIRERRAAGGRPVAEIMIPLTVTGAELAVARSWIELEIAEHVASLGAQGPAESGVTVGTMIETPRAALRAADLAPHADFFSFGTNDLTQLTFGFSRDDVGRRLVPTYLEQGVLPANPFVTIDVDGVGELVREAARRGRAARPDLKLGVCGEHGGDPDSIELFHAIGVDYVSCSPYRVPIARLAAAQAVIRRSER